MDKHYTPEDIYKLVEANKGIIIKICQSYCKNETDRNDLAQEIIYQLLRAGKRFEAGYKFSTWMYRVALNTAISFYRKESKTVPVISLSGMDLEIADVHHLNEEAESHLKTLQHFIADLKELDKAMMLLYFEEKSYKEIADIIGITETNVATKISRIKERIKQHFINLQRTNNGRR